MYSHHRPLLLSTQSCGSEMRSLKVSPVGHQAVLGSRCPLFILLKLLYVVCLNAVPPPTHISHPDFQNLSMSFAAKDGIEGGGEEGDWRPSEGRTEV